ncbi:MAG TPA: 16S rRNA (adenine(1518)-N(6)/adenine(1519)-N(6))-dimethyltransferase RsmA [Pirellulaceae bacterium]|nr:16S rRNA (adenine(1518)-N(6)/adenine(1519)-N(6))-dimethyltransferase RsmA [Pirellulaceae bacterium]HMO91765.1 16S rRNA (adenine(1518)-N(6)/adenine(1519)-N(6))-dimethyltransferase RsmA [Pirellulaceae bacterium]HMP69564.1 16S rRNA (adenine(1518)-N(6)/adenine(1519)-N(6))-dimethyltransferase RsmA [Pirellulaceae bacterium]
MSNTPSHNRQTISYLKKRFNEVGLTPNARHGQNFLIDYNLLELLARSAKIQPTDVVLEIGTGTGSLTALVAPQAARMVTVELDRHLFQLAREELETQSNLTMLLQDALKNKNRLEPRVMEAVEAAMRDCNTDTFRLVANLPYCIATPIISNLLRDEPVPKSMTVTIQKELADRMLAHPSTKDYSALSVWVQSLCDLELIRILPPSVFWPRPKVESAIIHIEPNPEKRALIPDLSFFHTFVRSLFFHRRKYLRSVLVSGFKEQLEKPDVDEVMQQMGLGAMSRAEELSIDQIQTLCTAFRDKLNTKR